MYKIFVSVFVTSIIISSADLARSDQIDIVGFNIGMSQHEVEKRLTPAGLMSSYGFCNVLITKNQSYKTEDNIGSIDITYNNSPNGLIATEIKRSAPYVVSDQEIISSIKEKYGDWSYRLFRRQQTIANCGNRCPPEGHIIRYNRGDEELEFYISRQKYTIKHRTPTGYFTSYIKNSTLSKRLKNQMISLKQKEIDMCLQKTQNSTKTKL